MNDGWFSNIRVGEWIEEMQRQFALVESATVRLLTDYYANLYMWTFTSSSNRSTKSACIYAKFYRHIFFLNLVHVMKNFTVEHAENSWNLNIYEVRLADFFITIASLIPTVFLVLILRRPTLDTSQWANSHITRISAYSLLLNTNSFPDEISFPKIDFSYSIQSRVILFFMHGLHIGDVDMRLSWDRRTLRQTFFQSSSATSLNDFRFMRREL